MGSHVLQHLDRGEPALPSAAESPGGLGSPCCPVQHNPGGGVGGGPLPLPSRQQPPHRAGTKVVFSAASRKAPVAWRAPQAAESEKMAAASAEAGEQRGKLFEPKEGPRSQTPSSILPVVSLQESPLPVGTVRSGRRPVSTSMEADEHEKWFREPPPPSLKSS